MPSSPEKSFSFAYLGEPVRVVEDLGDGWIVVEWMDGRRWRQWEAQVRPRHETAPPAAAAPEPSTPGTYRVWTDASVGGPGQGRARWAAVIETPTGEREEMVGDIAHATSSQAEMIALIECLRSLPDGATVEAFFDCKGIERVFAEWHQAGLPREGRNLHWRSLLQHQLLRLRATGSRITSSPEHRRCHELAKLSGPSVRQRRRTAPNGIRDDQKAIDRLTRGVRV